MAERMDDHNDRTLRGKDDLDRTTRRTDDSVDGEAVGGVSGLAAGAAIGAVTGGPIGAVIGAAAGALTGVGVAKGVDAAVNHEEEDAYWRDNYGTRPYATSVTRPLAGVRPVAICPAVAPHTFVRAALR